MADNNDKASEAAKNALKEVEKMIKAQKTLNKSTKDIADSWNAVASEIFKMDGAQFFKNVAKGSDELKKMGEEAQELQGQFNKMAENLDTLIEKNIEGTTGLKSALLGIGDVHKNNAKLMESNISKSYREQSNFSQHLKDLIMAEGGMEKMLKSKEAMAKLSDKEMVSLKLVQKLNEETKKFQKSSLEYEESIGLELNKLIAEKGQIAAIDRKISTEMLRQIAEGKQISELRKKANTEELKFLALLGGDVEETNKLVKGMLGASAAQEDIIKRAKETNKEFSLGKTLIGSISSAASGLGSIIKKEWVNSMMKFDEVLNNVQKQTGINMDENSGKFAELQTSVAQFGMSVEQAGQMMADMSSELNTTNFSVLSTAAKDFAAIEGATGAASSDITELAGNLMRMGESSEQVKDFMQGADQDARKFGVSSKRVLESISKNMTKMRTMGFVGGEESLKKMAIQAERLHMNVSSIFDMAEHARNIEGAMEMASELQLAGGSFANINPMDLLAAARKGPAELQKILTSMGKDIGKFNENGEYVFDPIDADRLKIAADAAHVPVDEFQKMIAQNATDSAKLNPFQGTIDGIEAADKDLAKSTLSDMLKRNANGEISIDVESDMAKKMGITELAQITPDLMNKMVQQKKDDAVTLDEQNKRNQNLKQSFDNFINAFMSIFSVFQPVLEALTAVMQGITSALSTVMNWAGPWGKGILAGLVIFAVMFKSSVGDMIRGLAGGIGKMAGGIKNKAMGAIGLGGGAGAEVGDGGTTKGLDMAKTWDGIKSSISKVAVGIKDSIGGIFNFIKDIAGQIIGFIGDIIGQILDLATRIVDGLTTVLESASKAVGVVQKIVGQLVGIVTKTFISLMTALGQGITAFASAAATGLGILTPFIPIILILTVAIIGLAFAFKLFAEGLASLAPLITSVFNGIATVILAVGTAVSMVISTIADSIVKLSNIDAMNLFALAAGLGVLSIAMIAFGAASAIGGVMSFFGGGMFSQLSELALLAPAIKVLGDSLNSAGDGLAKLSAAAESLSLDKLNKLKELSDSMSAASAGGAAMAAMANIANASGANGGEKTVKVQVDLKLNGRDIQTITTSGKVGSTHNV